MSDKKINVGVMDFTMYKSHSHFNTNFVNFIAQKVNKVVAATACGNLKIDEINKEKVELKEVWHPYSEKQTGFKLRKNLIKNQKLQYNKIKDSELSALIVLNFSIIHFAFAKKIYKSGKPIFLLLHDIDELKERRVFKFFKASQFFGKYIDKVNFIVLEDFKKDELINAHGISSERVFVVPWLPVGQKVTDATEKDNNLYISLSNSNDEGFVKEIIDQEISTAFFAKNNIKYILKSTESTFDNGFLKVYKDFLPAQEYEAYFRQANAVITPFPETFRIRVSGTTLDAFMVKKVVIGTKIPLMDVYAEKYPSMCKTYQSLAQLCQLLSEKKIFDVSQQDYDRFLADHSVEKLQTQIDKIIQKIKE